MRKLLIIFFLIQFTFAKNYSIPNDSLIHHGIKLIYNLEFEKAKKHFRNLMTDYPDYPGLRFFLAMVDWWKIILNTENQTYDEIFYDKLEDVIFHCDQLLKQNPKDAVALFYKGGAIGYRGRLRALRESWLKAADDALSAYPIVQEVAKLDENNIDVLLGFGIYNYYLSVMPEKFPLIKPFLVLFPKADKNLGLEQLTNVAYNGKFSRYEAMYFLMTSYLIYENLPYKALEFSKILYETFPNNIVFMRYYARLSFLTYNVDNAVYTYEKLLEELANKKYNVSKYFKREVYYYLAASYKIKRDYNNAINYFDKALEFCKLLNDEKSGFVVLSKLYLANIYDIQNKREEAQKLYQELLGLPDLYNSHYYANQYLGNPYKE